MRYLIILLLLAGCASNRGGPNNLYDFGPLPEAAQAMPLPALVVAEVSGAAALDSQMMIYRLNYADPLQARPYANSHWASAPLQMLSQRIKARLAQGGAKVLGVTDASSGVLLLRIDVDEFSHSFDSVSASNGVLSLRASLFDGHKLVDQRTFTRRTPARSADASGGARALAASTDAVCADMMAWISALPTKK